MSSVVVMPEVFFNAHQPHANDRSNKPPFLNLISSRCAGGLEIHEVLKIPSTRRARPGYSRGPPRFCIFATGFAIATGFGLGYPMMIPI